MQETLRDGPIENPPPERFYVLYGTRTVHHSRYIWISIKIRERGFLSPGGAGSADLKKQATHAHIRRVEPILFLQ